MREKRRRLFGRLWVASIALTALSIVALAVELIQGMQSPVPTRIATRSSKKNDTANKNDPFSKNAPLSEYETGQKNDVLRHVVRKPAASPERPVSTAAAREWSN